MENYLDHFTANTNYINKKRISVFKSVFDSKLADAKIWKIINPYFKVSSARILKIEHRK
jgi:sialic acid synthase SpsE